MSDPVEAMDKFAEALVADFPASSPDADWWNRLDEDARFRWLSDHSLPVSMATLPPEHGATRFEDEAGHRPEPAPGQRA